MANKQRNVAFMAKNGLKRRKEPKTALEWRAEIRTGYTSRSTRRYPPKGRMCCDGCRRASPVAEEVENPGERASLNVELAHAFLA
ncbi:MAG TPA: hypothetical protein QGG32_05730, partial [Rhodospirillales bacterium]|nr:hypothetical protein [Rhodospirillales bacterium]